MCNIEKSIEIKNLGSGYSPHSYSTYAAAAQLIEKSKAKNIENFTPNVNFLLTRFNNFATC